MENSNNDENKRSTGFLGGLFLGIIGLLLCICLYPENSKARKTFTQGWIDGFIAAIALGALFGAVVGLTILL